MMPSSAEDGVIGNIAVLNEASPPAQTNTAQAPHLSPLLEAAVAPSRDGKTADTSFEAFVTARSADDALRAWFAIPPNAPFGMDKPELIARLAHGIAELDALLSEQVNAILHHPRFQQLEASWRGLRFLAEKAVQEADKETVTIRVLNVSWKELSRDIEKAIEFDQSQLFAKIYSEEFGTPGGQPFGALLCDYAVRHRPGAGKPIDDLTVMRGISEAAAATFAPAILGTDPAFFGVDSFAELGVPLNLESIFTQREYTRWQSMRDREEARFLGLTMPRVLVRLPYEDDGSRTDGFRFHEDVSGPNNQKYLWGNAVYAYGTLLIRSFAESGWLANIQGVERGVESGGLVTDLPAHTFGTDAMGLVTKYSTDVLITDHQERELEQLGFLPLCHCKDTPWSAFYGSASTQRPETSDREAASANARLSSMLHHIFCVSRIAQYLKVIGRDKVGSFKTPAECEDFLQRWLNNYCVALDDMSSEQRAQYPLREGRVQVKEKPGKPGQYTCVIHLKPHSQLDQVVTAVKLETEIVPATN